MTRAVSIDADPVHSQQAKEGTGNRPERLEWFDDQALGLLITWSVDATLGMVISHALVDAEEDFCRRYFEELPRHFHADQFNPTEWARLAKLAGFKYVAVIAKHHSGFCMWDTKTTDFNVMNTPLKRDVTREMLEAFRQEGIAAGLYFSPDDFWFLHQQGIPISRRGKGVTPQENPELMEYTKRQLRELMTEYGDIEVMFIDGPADGLRELVWELQPDCVITRGAMITPEQGVPGTEIPGAWETCMTIGTQWQFKPTNETYKSGTELIETFIENRAKGGNLLLSVGPHPDGPIPFEQERRLRELGLWNFINGEAIFAADPWIITNEGHTYFTRRDDTNTVYAILTQPNWKWGTRKEILLKSVRATPDTQVSVVGQNSKILEYNPEADATLRWEQKDDGLHISAMRTHRIYNDREWPNPIVLRIKDAEPGPTPARVRTIRVEVGEDHQARLTGDLQLPDDVEQATVRFQLRTHEDPTEPLAEVGPWFTTPQEIKTQSGEFTALSEPLEPGTAYECRAMVEDGVYTRYGETRLLMVPASDS